MTEWWMSLTGMGQVFACIAQARALLEPMGLVADEGQRHARGLGGL